MTERGSSRAQSHTVGVILLTAVIVILIGVFGGFYLGVTSDRADRYGPLLDAEVNATDEQVFLTHRGGDSIAVDELAVTIRRGGTSERHALAVADVTRVRTPNDAERFEPTERIEHAHDLGAGRIEVMVIHVSSNTMLHQDHLDVVAGSGTPTVASFEYTPAAPEPGDTVTFDAGDSIGTGGVDSYGWEFGDGDAGTGETVTHTFSTAGDYDVTLTVEADNGDIDETTRTVVVESVSPPTIESASLTDGDDDLVATGDDVDVTATVTAGTYAVDTVTADASAFAAGTVTLTDGNGDGTYEATFEVGDSPTEGARTVTVEATDVDGNGVTTETDDEVTVDTTPPEIGEFSVVDQSGVGSIWGYYVEAYRVQWLVTDSTSGIADSTMYVNRTDGTQATYDSTSGDREYSNTRGFFDYSGREHVITVVAQDETGNRACRSVTDAANGTDPSDSAFESC